MSFPDESTLRRLTAPSVVAIGCPPRLAARCAKAAEGLGAIFVSADVAHAPTVAAERRPLAMVLADDLYAFDPDEFDALARDVGASLVKVEESVSAAKLEMLLSAAIDASMARRREAAAREGAAVSQRPRSGPPDRGSPPSSR